jgi:inhibitor of KinA
MMRNIRYTLYSLGDTALIVDFGKEIDEAINEKVMALYRYLTVHSLKGITDLVPAYSSLTIYYDPAAYLPEISQGISITELLSEHLLNIGEHELESSSKDQRVTRIPVCYERPYAPDLADVAAAKGLTIPEVIKLHTSSTYRVYMLGFLPGFAYMGITDKAIEVPRKQQPCTIAAGSVGLAGRQTGIYPLASPGGWQIIGRTPLSLFTVSTGDTLLQPGDNVQFYSIRSYEFDHY